MTIVDNTNLKKVLPMERSTNSLGIKTALLVLLFLTAAESGCLQPEIGEKTVKIEDMAGRSVLVPKDVGRVVALKAGTLRLLTYINGIDRIVGVEQIEKTDCTRPYILAHPKLSKLPSVGPIHGGDAELITAQEPDVIFCTYISVREANELQHKTATPVIVLEYGGIGSDELTESLMIIGKVLGEEDRALEIQDFFKRVTADLEDRVCGESAEVYVGGIGYHGAHGLLSTELSYPPFKYLHVKNVAGSLGVEHAYIDEEALLEWDPAIIFIDELGYPLIKEELKRRAYRNLGAFRTGEIYGVLPYNSYTTNFGTVLANAYYIGVVLYPDQFSGVDPAEKADEIYEMLLGSEVYGQMEEIYGGFGKLNCNSN